MKTLPSIRRQTSRWSLHGGGDPQRGVERFVPPSSLPSAKDGQPAGWSRSGTKLKDAHRSKIHRPQEQTGLPGIWKALQSPGPLAFRAQRGISIRSQAARRNVGPTNQSGTSHCLLRQTAGASLSRNAGPRGQANGVQRFYEPAPA